jgi:hypothetical protein
MGCYPTKKFSILMPPNTIQREGGLHAERDTGTAISKVLRDESSIKLVVNVGRPGFWLSPIKS